MASLVQYYGKTGLTDIGKAMKEPKTFLVSMLFQREKKFATRDVRLDLVDNGRRKSTYVLRDEQGNVIEKDSFTKNRLTPPYMKPKTLIRPSDLQELMPGGLVEFQEGQVIPEIEEFIAEKSLLLEENVTRAEEVQAAQALLTGVVTAYNDKGQIIYSVDYGRHADLTYNVGTAWSAAGAFPLKDLSLMRNRIQKHGGGLARVVIFDGEESAQNFMEHANVRNLISTDYGRRGQFVWEMEAKGAVYLGNVDGFELYSYNEYYTDPADDVEKALIPAGKVIVANPDAIRTRTYGAIEHMDQLSPAARFANVYSAGDDISGTWLQLHSAPLMVTNHINGAGVLDTSP